MTTYYIYEVIGEKNGATINWDKRSQENFDMYSIWPIVVETMEGPNTPEMWQIVGDREWELADLNGYRRGTHYRVAREKRIQASTLVGSKNRESGHIQSLNANRTKESYERAGVSISIAKTGMLSKLKGTKIKKETKEKIAETLRIFSDNEVLEIFNKYIPREYTYKDLAKEYKVHYRTIQNLILRHKKSH